MKNMSTKIINIILSLLILLSISYSESQSFITGNANFYYISRLDNGNIINMPYRMLNGTWSNRHNNFELKSRISFEYEPRENYSFFRDTPQDFLFDLREFYFTWFTNFGDIRIGKQIQSWGFVDENSPLDNTCAYDYNFLFETGTERKIGTTALSMDMYIQNFKFGFSLSPFHQMNRLPSEKAEFPIEFPVLPSDYLFFNIDKMNEFGSYLQVSTDIVDIGVSYFSGFDRIFNLSGLNIFSATHGSELYPDVDTVFTYRKTDVIGFGGALTLSDITLRADLGYFSTKDLNESIVREWPKPRNSAAGGATDDIYIMPNGKHATYPIKENAEYYQMTVQLEYQLPYSIDMLFQFFKHDILEYNAITPTIVKDSLNIPDFEADKFVPYNYFFPGMGSPLALMTHNAILLGIEKSFYNDRLSFQFRNLIDLDGFNENENYKGYFIELHTEYKLSDKITSSLAINYIKGDENHPNSSKNKGEEYVKALDYALNQMEDFSHFRMQLNYSF